MEARLYDVIRDYQRDRASVIGGTVRTFRVSSLRAYAARYPSRYPEYVVDAKRLPRAVQLARLSGEILPPASSQRDDILWLRIDGDSMPT